MFIQGDLLADSSNKYYSSYNSNVALPDDFAVLNCPFFSATPCPFFSLGETLLNISISLQCQYSILEL